VKAAVLAASLSELVRAHHEAFAVEVLGADASGVSPERIQELLDAGHLDPAALSGFTIPGMRNDVDPYLFTAMVSQVFDATDPAERHKLRTWPMSAWSAAVDARIDAAPTFTPQFPSTSIRVEKPDPGGQAPAPSRAEAPEWLSDNEAYAYQSAQYRAGQYARGLGDTLADELGNVVLETWDEEEIVTEADAELRQERLEQIREATTEAIERHDDPERLAVDLMRRTDDWEHNWERIARTELQGAYNEGRIMGAIEAYGSAAQIARVTETNACRYCLALLRDEKGNPRVFTIQELLANGTNVGKPRSSWSASTWPIHPNCRCDTVVVPPGMTVGPHGELLAEEKA